MLLNTGSQINAADTKVSEDQPLYHLAKMTDDVMSEFSDEMHANKKRKQL